MKPFIDFKYQPHSSKAEDKKIRDWRVEHDPDSKAFTRWNLFLLISIPIFTMLFMTCTLYLGMTYARKLENGLYWLGEKEYQFLVWLDTLPVWFWCIFTGACVMAIVLVCRGKKDRV